MASLSFTYHTSCETGYSPQGTFTLDSITFPPSQSGDPQDGSFSLTLVGANGHDYGTQFNVGASIPFSVYQLPNQDYVARLHYYTPDGLETNTSGASTFSLSCAVVCDLQLGTITYPSLGAYTLPFTTSYGDRKATVTRTGTAVGSFVGSPYQGSGTPGDAFSVLVVDRAGCSQSIQVVLPAAPPPPPADPDPTLTLVNKNQGYIGDGVVLTGTLFTGTTKVTFSGVSATYTVLSNTSIQTSVPVGTVTGPVQVEVGTKYTNTLPFTLLTVAPPPVVVDPTPAVDGFTISWQLDFNSWTGEHTTIPDWYLTRNMDTYRATKGSLQKQTLATYGLPLTLTWSANGDPLQQKTFDNLVLEQEITDSSLAQPFLRYKTFSTLQVSTTFHHTGVLIPHVPLSYADKWSRVLDPTQVMASFEKDQYNLEIPGSVVVDVDKDITSPTNWDTAKRFKPRVSGKWALFTLTFLGTPTQKLLLHTARVVSRLIPR